MMRHEAKRETVWTALAFATLALAALLQRQLVMANPDVAWLLTVADKVMSGQRLYVDVLETNPPASVWLYMPFAWLGRVTSVRPETLVDGLFVAGAALSAWTMPAWLGAGFRNRLWLVRCLAFAVLALLPASCFGEREHAALILFLPLLALARRRADGETIPFSLALAASLPVAVVACLKPHFVVAIVLTSLAAAAVARSLRPLFSVENCVGAALFLAYVASTFAVYPAFWSEMIPISNLLYIPARLPVMALLHGSLPLVLLELAIMAGFLFVRRSPLLRTTAFLVACASITGFLLIAIAQGKGWPYHFYPALGLLVLLIGTSLIVDLHDVAKTRLVTASSTVIFSVQFWLLFNAGLDMRSFYERMRAIDAHPRIASIASDFALGFPTVRALQGEWIGRSFSRWIPYHVAGLSMEPGFDASLLPQFQAMEKADRDGLVADLRSGRPTLILVERRPFDFLAWANKDDRLRAVLACYEAADRILVGNLDTAQSQGLDVELYRPRGMTDASRPLGCAPDR